jgi:hypothetical protein
MLSPERHTDASQLVGLSLLGLGLGGLRPTGWPVFVFFCGGGSHSIRVLVPSLVRWFPRVGGV